MRLNSNGQMIKKNERQKKEEKEKMENRRE
jgi:hypothetical protein